MKRIVIQLVALAFLPFMLQAQTVLKGSIKYQLTYNMEQKDQFAAYLPSQSIMSTNGTEALVKTLNSKGKTMAEFIAVKGEGYMLDRVDKIAYKIPKSEENADKTKIIKTEEFETILNHKCRKWVVEDGNGKKVQTIWATKDYSLSDSFFKYMNMGSSNFSDTYKKIEGVPLKMVMGEGSSTIEMKATSISTTVPSASELKLPSDYTVEPFNAMVIGKMMMRSN